MLNRARCLLILLMAGLAGCSREGGKPVRAAAAPKALPITAAAAQVQSAQRVFEVTGTLLPYEAVVVSSEVDGTVARILVDLGDRVKEGQALAEINRSEFQIQLAQAAASLQQAMARLGLKPGEDPQSVKEEQTSEVLRARAALDESALQYRRAGNLFDLQIGTQQAVDTAEAAYKTAQANYRSSIDQVRTLKAQIEQYRAAQELAGKKLNDTTLRAPFAGSIQERHISPGQYLKVQAAAFSMVQTNPLRLRAEVAERFARAVRENQRVKVTVDGLAQSFSARISRVSPAITQQSRTLLVEALVENREQLLRPGVFARAAIVSDQMENVLLVPAAAVVNYYGINKVFAVENGKVRERPVKLGDRFGEHFEVLEGLQPRELVATSSLEKLTLGTAVEVQSQKSKVQTPGSPAQP